MRIPLKSFCFTLILITIISTGNFLQAKVYKLYYLGGQSNMDGFGLVRELPKNLNKPLKGVMIYHGNPSPDGAPADGLGKWTVLRPGHGAGFESDGKENTYSDRFGVELTFAQRLTELDPKANIAIIKYSLGATSIDTGAAGEAGCWDPDFQAGNGVNQYDHFLATVRQALSVFDIDTDGVNDTLIPAGIIWMQGEGDASYTEEIAQRYPANLKRLMDLIRAAFRFDDLPVVIGRISDSGRYDRTGKVWEHGEIVRKGQADFVREDGHAFLVTSTDQYGYSDPWHYDSAGYIDLGKKFAEAIFSFSKDLR